MRFITRCERDCLARGRLWQAEYWQSGVRDYGLHLACLRRNLPARNGRGFDDLPAEVQDAYKDALARSLDPEELLRALQVAVAKLLQEAAEEPQIAEMVRQIEPQLRELIGAWESN
jgi:hypothetical protein